MSGREGMVGTPGQLVGGRYRVVGLLGEGGMGRVLRARDEELGRDVALKVVSPRVLGQPSVLARFAREARLQARVDHPGVLRIFDVMVESEEAWMAMELIRGQDLDARVLAEGPLGEDAWWRLARGLAAGLDCLHQAGVLHRDLKPGNVMLRSDGSPVLMDLGLATAEEVTALTATGSFLGTPLYTPPEVLLGEPWAPAGDRWQLAAVLFFAAAGYPPVPGKTLPEVLENIAAGAWRRLPEDAPASLQEGLRQGLTRDPAQRPASSAALLQACEGRGESPTSTAALAPLGTSQLPEPRAPRSRGRVALLGLAAAGVLLGLGLGRRGVEAPVSPGEDLAPPEVPALADLVRQALARHPLPRTEAGPDPGGFAGWLEASPEVREALAFALAGGAERQELEDADRVARAAGCPAPFAHLYGPDQEPLTLWPGDPWLVDYPRPGEVRGWLAAALRSWRRAREQREFLAEEVARWSRGEPSGFPGTEISPVDPHRLARSRLLGEAPPLTDLGGFLADPGARARLHRFWGLAQEDFRRLVRALERHAATGAEGSRELASELLYLAVRDLAPLYLDPVWMAPPEQVLGPVPARPGPALAALWAMVWELWEDSTRTLGGGEVEDGARRQRLLAPALAWDPGAPAARRRLASHALVLELRSMVRTATPGEVLARLEARRAPWEALPPARRGPLVEMLASRLQRAAQAEVPPPRGEVEAALGLLASEAEVYRQAGGDRELLVDIDRRLRRVREALAAGG